MFPIVAAGLTSTHLAHTGPAGTVVKASISGNLQILGVTVFAFLMLGFGSYAWISARESEKHQNKWLRSASWMYVLAAFGVSGAIVTALTNTFHAGASGLGGVFGVTGNVILFIFGIVAVVELFKRAHILRGEVPNWGPALAFGAPTILLMGPFYPALAAVSTVLATGTSPLTAWLGN